MAVDGHDTLLATFEATEKAVDVAFRKRNRLPSHGSLLLGVGRGARFVD